ncbi:MAG: VWA domain-containing protein, partial [Verrucomicrobiales bacterium]|nr:VWA domain-containing protein [Verrucomicrobiales bacterium]
EERASIVTFAKESTWVWDYGEEAAAAPPAGPTQISANPIPVSLVPASVPTGPPDTTLPLQPPYFSPPGGNYPITDFDLAVTISDNNPSGRSELVYSLNYGDWTPYTGPVVVPPNSNLRAQATPLMDEWVSSSITSATYGMLPGVLTAPTITLSAPSFDQSTSTIDIAIANPNGTGSSVIFYALRAPSGNYPEVSSYNLYSDSFSVDSTTYPDGLYIHAYATSLDVGSWGDSPFTEAAVQATFFDIPLTGDRILFVLDASSSMGDSYCSTGLDRFEVALNELVSAISALGAAKEFGIAMFDAGQHWVYNSFELQPATVTNKQSAISAVSTVDYDSGTSYEAGLAFPLQYSTHPDQVIFLSDGSPNSSTGWHDELDALKAEGIQVDCVGIDCDTGEKANLSFIASETGGSTSFLDCEETGNDDDDDDDDD